MNNNNLPPTQYSLPPTNTPNQPVLSHPQQLSSGYPLQQHPHNPQYMPYYSQQGLPHAPMQHNAIIHTQQQQQQLPQKLVPISELSNIPPAQSPASVPISSPFNKTNPTQINFNPTNNSVPNTNSADSVIRTTIRPSNVTPSSIAMQQQPQQQQSISSSQQSNANVHSKVNQSSVPVPQVSSGNIPKKTNTNALFAQFLKTKEENLSLEDKVDLMAQLICLQAAKIKTLEERIYQFESILPKPAQDQLSSNIPNNSNQ